ncbi:MAG: DNA polymerase IV [candidate division KSB1 bacterium]|nr:DNA polymerase IV [candidate division KSB1 bacterium]MDZ7275056.1 DNA polymerase IV [candidate division KSB1 bacterium]MDZ7286496.1 DNA polymerase IV [candidate division KSB1 bacterium]MDZ7299340.1 DNA polymerase IV [candidate division KSB1 bacterium]MDZ7306332.1 DNA polymerase IV [candidate division KSB1 bacterium]
MSCARPQSSPARYILHVDMDAFYAAIEELDHPQYRGQPLVVGADPRGGRGRGVVSTANYVARTYGIRSAMPISTAWRLCPHAIYLPGRPQRYAEVSRLVMAILADYSPQVLQISIDEAFLDVTHTHHAYGSAQALAGHLKQRIKQETGLTASVGLAGNMFVAKVASDLQKPDGLTICPPGREREFLAPLPVAKLWGVGPKTEKRLRDYGFTTIGEVAQAPQEKLAKIFGQWGAQLWKLANGIDPRPVEDWGPRKSISQEFTFDEDEADMQVVEKRLWKIADDLSADMRREQLKGRVLTLKIRLEGFLTFTRRQTLGHYTNDAAEMRDLALGLLHRFDRQGRKIRLIGLGMAELNNMGGEQLQLFDDTTSPLHAKVAGVLDELRRKFGEQAAARASLLGERSHRFLGREELPDRTAKPQEPA